MKTTGFNQAQTFVSLCWAEEHVSVSEFCRKHQAGLVDQSRDQFIREDVVNSGGRMFWATFFGKSCTGSVSHPGNTNVIAR